MEEKVKQSASYQIDQKIIDARGINITVEEVVVLPTTKYSERIKSMHLCTEDMMFLKSLRRRIKNRLASQNSRKRSVEQLRMLTRELRVVRKCKVDAVSERNMLLNERLCILEKCRTLREYIQQNLKDNSDIPELPTINCQINDRITNLHSQNNKNTKYNIEPVVTKPNIEPPNEKIQNGIFECRLERLVQQSVNHIYKDRSDKTRIVCAKTIFLNEEYPTSDDRKRDVFKIENVSSNVNQLSLTDKKLLMSDCEKKTAAEVCLEESLGVLNLSLKQNMENARLDSGRRKSHGRKQSAPRRIIHDYDYFEDLKVKKDAQ